LVLRGKALLAVPGLPEAPALQSGLAKLEGSLGDETLGKLGSRIEYAATTEDGGAAKDDSIVSALREAAGEGKQLELNYYSASSDSTSLRIVDPEEVFTDRGYWYVVAWDHSAGAERMFRADRIREARATGATFARRGLAGAGRPLYERTDGDIEVELRLGPSVRWVAEYYEVESSAEKNGFLEVVIPTKRLEWVEKLLLRLGPEAEIVGPPALPGRVRELAERTLALYH
jgi:proteasome accessory factor C